MKRLILNFCSIVSLVILIFTAPLQAQNSFDPEKYILFLQDNKDLESEDFISRFASEKPFYSGIAGELVPTDILYLDSIIKKYHLTDSELELLGKNNFLVSERLSFDKITPALNDIFQKDLPIFVSTDAILHALHISYGNLLRDMEIQVLLPELTSSVDGLYQAFPDLVEKYGSNPGFHASLADVDLYLTIAKSLLDKTLIAPQYTDSESVKEIWDAIESEAFVSMPLFTDISRLLDFSQFAIRGHYARYEELHGYFKCMIWLGRMEFVLADAPKEWYEEGFTKEGLRRLNIDALMINELLQASGTLGGFSEIDRIIAFMVGESDNLRPADYSDLADNLEIKGAEYLLDDTNFDSLQEAMLSSTEYQQKILSGYMKGNPETMEPTALPVSYRLLGQRFIIDSYIFYKLVYDNVVYQERKVCRMMPDPLDAIFALGNDNALPLLSDELEAWNYSSQLAGLRYLVDAYEADFWGESLYNNWLQAIRLLNPVEEDLDHPIFMNTVAWQQQKINTQLASWTQLRHDNLLYAKQSYTHGGECMFPHSYVEPYPSFYRQIASFAEKAETFDAFDKIHGYSTYQSVAEYFEAMKTTMGILETVAQKELSGQALTEEEKNFLGDMLIEGNMSGPEFNGWYVDLLYDSDGGPRYVSDPADSDFLVADGHTQPTDCGGNVVGRILHVGVGQVNMGIFLVQPPGDNTKKMAYVGPVMSYYETITNDFDRLTDEGWTKIIQEGNAPVRPDWVNVYLADKEGEAYSKGRELDGELFTGIHNYQLSSKELSLGKIYPNPFETSLIISYAIPNTSSTKNLHSTKVELSILNIQGQIIETLVFADQGPGDYKIEWNSGDVPGGVYFILLRAGNQQQLRKTIRLPNTFDK